MDQQPGSPHYDLRLSEYHTGLRAYSRKLLETIDYHANSDDFVFDQELVGQVIRAGFRIAEIPIPTRYFAEARSVDFRRSTKYGFGILSTLYRHRVGKRIQLANGEPAQ